MGIFDNLFTKKKIINDRTPSETNLDVLEQAEQLSNIVALGVEQENYTELNQQLSNFVSKDTEKEQYIFEHPKIERNVIAIIVCMVFSLLYLYFVFISLGTILLSPKHFILGLIGIATSLVLLIANIVLISKLISTIKYKHRYEKYTNILRFRSFEIINDLAVLTKVNEVTIVKDLNNSIRHKLIPQGHFTRENLVFMISNEIYDKYTEKQAVFDRYFKKQIEERNRMKERTEEMKRIMEMGTQYIDKIHDSKTLIKDKSVSKKIDRMETIVSMIFREVDANPSQSTSLGMFLNYYLPTTDKLIEAYISIGEKQITGKSLSNTKKEIENSLDTIILAFENILEKMYEEHEMDISSDIAAMEIIMEQEGLTE